MIDFDPTIGHEIQKTRPVIIQNDISNQLQPHHHRGGHQFAIL